MGQVSVKKLKTSKKAKTSITIRKITFCMNFHEKGLLKSATVNSRRLV